MEEDKEESSKKKVRQEQDNPPATAASLLTDDLILEVLSRLPARSVRRFKCVSAPWRDLIADPVHRKKLPQTLDGFLYTTYKPGAWSHHFASFSGGAAPVDPSLRFLQPSKYKHITHVDTCNGLLLCACFNKETPTANKDDFRYVVCNPATERWIELPPQSQDFENRFHCTARLAFDPMVSSHFHVLEFVEPILGVGTCVTGVDIFSSQTGAWIHRDSGWVGQVRLFHGTRSVFFRGMLHLVGSLKPINIDDRGSALVVLVLVDMEGKVWKTMGLPVGSSFEAIGMSQGCLYYAGTSEVLAYNSGKRNALVASTIITLWCLENYDSKVWVLKHTATIDEPLGITWVECRVFAIHPDCNTVFLVPIGGDMMAYDMEHRKFVHILNLEEYNLRIYLPYVPLFSEALADADGQ